MNEPKRAETSRVTFFDEGGKRLVLKEQTNYKVFDLAAHEVFILKNFTGIRGFPQVVRLTKGGFVMQWAGVPLTKVNKPNDLREQLARILAILISKGITHRDIRPENLVVKDGVITLIDFGWAVGENQELFGPDNIGDTFKSPHGWDDGYSMDRVIKFYE